MIDLNKIVVAIENYADSQELSHMGKLIVDDALYLLVDEVIGEGITEIKTTVDLAYHVSQCRVENRGLTFNDFVELVSGASLGIVGTYKTFKRYLTKEDFEKWENDTLDMSKFLGHKKGLEYIYLQAKYLYEGYHLILKFCELQVLLNA